MDACVRGWKAIVLACFLWGLYPGGGVAGDHTQLTGETTMLKKMNDSLVDAEALTMSGGKFADDINSRVNQQEALVTHAGYQYVVYYDKERHVCLARRKLPQGEWSILRFTDYTFKKNDSHCSINMGICPRDGTIHLAFDHHNDPLHYRVSIPGVVTDPESASWTVDSFGPVRSALQEGKPLRKLTYPRFWQTPAGGLQFLYRIGGSGRGDRYLVDYDPDSHKWGDARQFDSRHGAYLRSNSRCSYPSPCEYGPRGLLHVTWVWREGPSKPNHDLNYAYSPDQGRTWRNSAGEAVAFPISIDTPGICVVEIGFDYGLVNGYGQTVDSQGRIHVVVRHCSDASFQASGHRPGEERWGAPAARRYHHYWRAADGQWHHYEMPWVAHGGTRVYADAHDNLYFTYRDGENLVVAGATAAAKWTDWRILHEETGPFISSFTGDSSRVKREGALSVFAQDMPEKAGQPTRLRVLDFCIMSLSSHDPRETGFSR